MNILKRDSFIINMFNNFINNYSTLKIIKRNPENSEQFNEYFINNVTNINIFAKQEIYEYSEYGYFRLVQGDFLKGIDIKNNSNNILFKLPANYFNNLSFIFDSNKIIIKGKGLFEVFEIIAEN